RVHKSRRGCELHVVAHACRYGESGAYLPRVFCKSVDHLHPEVVLALCSGLGIDHIGSLDKCSVVVPSVSIGIAGLSLKGIENPVLEVGNCRGLAIAVDAAALEEIDHDFVDNVCIAAKLEAMTSMHLRENI